MDDTVIYAVKHDHKTGRALIMSAPVIRETPSFYIIERNRAEFGYRTRIPKAYAHLTPGAALAAARAEKYAAWDRYRARTQVLRVELDEIDAAIKRLEG